MTNWEAFWWAAAAGSLAVVAIFAQWALRAPGRWVAAFACSAILLPPLPVSVGSSGPHLSLLLLLAGLREARRRRLFRQIPSDPAGWALAGYLAAAAISLGPAAYLFDIPTAILSMVRLLLAAGAALVYWEGTVPANRGETGTLWVRYIWICSLIAFGLALADFVVQAPPPAGYSPHYLVLDSGRYRRAQGMFYDSSALGALAAFILTGGVAMHLGRWYFRFPPRMITMTMIAAGAVLLASYSRGALLNAVVGIGALVWIHRDRFQNIRRTGILLTGLATLAAILLLFGDFAVAYFGRLIYTFIWFWEGRPEALSGRVASWAGILETIVRHPLVLVSGQGYKTLPTGTAGGGMAIIADNQYLSTLVETGLPGLAMLGAFLGLLFYSGMRAARSADPAARIAGRWTQCFWLGLAAQMLTADLMTYWRILPAFFAVASITAGRIPRPAPAARPRASDEDPR